jgi:hypothetical protein
MKHNQPSLPLLARLRRRRRERGAAVFVVVMVITLLLGIGVLAARSASLGTAASGNERQMTQTHYMSEYAMLLVVANLASTSGGVNSKAASYIHMAKDPTSGDWGKCIGQTNQAIPAANLPRPTCYRMASTETEAEMAPADHVVNPYGLGSPTIEGFFWVEITDVSGPAALQPGAQAQTAVAQNNGLVIYDVTATTIGQVRTKSLVPQVPGAPLDTTQIGNQSTELSRGFLRVGPI